MPSRPYPMGVGLDVDIESGEPLAVQQLAQHARREELRARAQERHQRLLDDLSGQGGEVLREVAARLAQRINMLISQDPEASAFFSLLSQVEQRCTAGERIAQDLLGAVLPEERT